MQLPSLLQRALIYSIIPNYQNNSTKIICFLTFNKSYIKKSSPSLNFTSCHLYDRGQRIRGQGHS